MSNQLITPRPRCYANSCSYVFQPLDITKSHDMQLYELEYTLHMISVSEKYVTQKSAQYCICNYHCQQLAVCVCLQSLHSFTLLIEVEKDDKGCYRCLVKTYVGNEFSHKAFLTILYVVSCPDYFSPSRKVRSGNKTIVIATHQVRRLVA